jgi:hypothetical protein
MVVPREYQMADGWVAKKELETADCLVVATDTGMAGQLVILKAECWVASWERC